jgi:hypothetical protein
VALVYYVVYVRPDRASVPSRSPVGNPEDMLP